MMRMPYISSVSGCNNSATTTDINNCDGESGMSIITVSGVNFTGDDAVWNTSHDSMAVNVVCQGRLYTATVNQTSVYDSQLTATTPRIEEMYVDQPCRLTLIHYNYQGFFINSPTASVNSATIRFSSFYSGDVPKPSYLTDVSLITLSYVVVVVVVGVTVIAAMLYTACHRSSVVDRPQSGGYSSMA